MARVRRGRFVGASGSMLAAFAIVRAPARAAQFEFKCASDFANDHPSTIRLGQMWAAIERESNGRIHTDFYPNNALGGTSAVISQVRLGAIAFFFTSPGNLAPIVPSTDICYLGFAYKDVDEGFRAMDGPLGGYLRDEIASKGMHALRTWWNSGMYELSSSSHPIRNPDDLKGFKVRVAPSKISVDLFKTLGAVPTSLGLNETYTALQTRLVDGTATPLATIETSRLYEVQKYISLTNHAWNCLAVFGHKETWDSLPPDLQEVVERNNRRYALLERNDSKLLNTTVTAKLASQGIVLNDVNPAPFRPALRPYYEYWANAFGPTEWGLLQTSLGRRLV